MSANIHILALTWGFVWAAILHFTRWGRWLAVRRTWITVVIGLGVDLLLLWRVLDRAQWWRVAEVVGLSAVGIVFRSLLQEYRDGTAA